MGQLSIAAATQFLAAQTLMKQNRFREAALACKAVCESLPNFPGGWHLGSAIALKLGHTGKALEYIDRALALDSENPCLLLHRARILLMVRQAEAANRLVEDVERAHGNDPSIFQDLARLLTLTNKHTQALPYYRRLCESESDNANHWYNLATTERFVGHVAAAEVAFDEHLQRAPGNYEAYYLRAGLRRQTPASNHVLELERLRTETTQWQGQYHLGYALAKSYEDLGDDASSFAALKAGADQRRAHMDYRVQDDLDVMNAIACAYPVEVSTHWPPGYDSTEPIFVVGLPRTGTTLVERILGNHGQVFAAGELNNFAIALSHAVEAKAGKPQGKLEAIAMSRNLDFEGLGRAYVDSTRPYTGHRPRFIDKMPLNFLYLGLIARALPNATIIELVRHPLDTCYAMYKQAFTVAYPFSYHLDDLAAYFCAYQRLMRHWHAALPGRILRLRYEDLVDDQLGQTKKILEHGALPWDDACLEFERNPQATTTASAIQVRQKLYRSSVGIWRRFETQLQPLTERLLADPIGRQALQEYGYPPLA